MTARAGSRRRISLTLVTALVGLMGCQSKAPVADRPPPPPMLTVGHVEIETKVFAAAAPVEGKIAVCAACHGPKGLGELELGSALARGAPALVGQTRMYLTLQLRAYANGQRSHPEMSPVAGLIQPADVEALAGHYAGLPTPPLRGAQAGLDDPVIARGHAIAQQGVRAKAVPACVTCHLEQGVGNAAFPRLAGQSAAYQVAQITAFRTGARKTQQAGVMKPIAAGLSDADSAAVAAYYASRVIPPAPSGAAPQPTDAARAAPDR